MAIAADTGPGQSSMVTGIVGVGCPPSLPGPPLEKVFLFEVPQLAMTSAAVSAAAQGSPFIGLAVLPR